MPCVPKSAPIAARAIYRGKGRSVPALLLVALDVARHAASDGADGGDDHSHDEEGDGHDDQGIFVREADGEDATGELPVCYGKGVGDPVCY